MFINKFIGHRQSGKTTFLCNIGNALVRKNDNIGLFVVPTRNEISNVKKHFVSNTRMQIVCVNDLRAGAGRGLCFDILLIDNVDKIRKEDYGFILALFHRENTLCYETINSESIIKETMVIIGK
jgi:hypothetical protein